MFPPRTRSLVSALTAAALLALGAGSAQALSPQKASSVADRIAIGWEKQQQPNGAFLDPVAKTPTGGYGNVMIGYSLMRAGERRHDPKLIRAGARAVTAGLYEPARFRGVFDQLSIAASYNWARAHLARDAFVRTRLPLWRAYLQRIGRPSAEGVLAACMADPKCFHNHEAAEDLADLELLDTGLRSTLPSAKLYDREALRRRVLLKINGDVTQSVGENGRTTWPGLERPLGMLSDTGQWANAYHALSTSMLAAMVARLGPRATPNTRGKLRITADTLDALMAPDGDVAYFGRRNEQSWALAATVSAGETAAAVLNDRRGAERWVGMADKAFDRIEKVHVRGPLGLQPLPRPYSGIEAYPGGVDANVAVSSGLTAFLLNQAADVAGRNRGVKPAELPASREGWFLQPDQSGFAAVRHGDLWYAIHRRPITSDPRFDFGLQSLKRKRADGSWEDLVHAHPLTHGKTVNSTGPVITYKSKRYVPWGSSIDVRPGGVVEVHGDWRYLRGATVGAWLRKDVTFRFEPVKNGISLSFPVKSGDNVRMTAYLPSGQARQGPNWVGDSRSTASLSTKPSRIKIGEGKLASCCDSHLAPATMSVRVGSDGRLAYTIAAGSRPGGPHAAPVKTRLPGQHADDGGGFPWGKVLVAAAAVLLVVALARQRARRRRRERERERRRRMAARR